MSSIVLTDSKNHTVHKRQARLQSFAIVVNRSILIGPWAKEIQTPCGHLNKVTIKTREVNDGPVRAVFRIKGNPS